MSKMGGNSRTIGGLSTEDGFNCKHRYLYHYTDEQGYNGIRSTRSIRPSTIEGVKNTHYGRGVYLTPLCPSEIPIIGAPEFLKRVFGGVTTHAVSRTRYYLRLRVDPNWYAMAAMTAEQSILLDDVWLVPGKGAMDVSKSMDEHGKTPIGVEVEAMGNKGTAERDYAYRLNQPDEPHQHLPPPKWSPPAFVWNGGQSVRRPKGWYEDAPSWWTPPQ